MRLMSMVAGEGSTAMTTLSEAMKGSFETMVSAISRSWSCCSIWN